MMGSRALVLRAGGVIALTVALAVAFAVTLAFFKFDQKLLEVTADRLAVVAQEVRRQAEVGLALGLDLAELDDLKGVVARSATAADVTRVDLADSGGVVRFSSDAGGEGRTVAPGIVAALPAATGKGGDGKGGDGKGGEGKGGHGKGSDAKGDDGFRRLIDGDRAILAVPLRNGFGQFAGTVVVEATVAAQRAQEGAVRGELIGAAAPVIAVALAVTLLAVMLTVRWSVGSEEVGRRADDDDDDDSAGLQATTASLHATLEPRLTAAIAGADQAMDDAAHRLGLGTREDRR